MDCFSPFRKVGRAAAASVIAATASTGLATQQQAQTPTPTQGATQPAAAAAQFVVPNQLTRC